MTTRCVGLACALFALALAGCDPDDACDPGYRPDHGYCYLSDGGYVDKFDATFDEDGGFLPGENPNATFGMPCKRQAECGGVAPVCGGPMLPICTAIQCMDTTLCPTGWQCFDVTKYSAAAPGVTSVCVPSQ